MINYAALNADLIAQTRQLQIARGMLRIANQSNITKWKRVVMAIFNRVRAALRRLIKFVSAELAGVTV